MGAENTRPSAQDMQLAMAIYERNKGMMLGTAAKYLRDLSLAEDILHDAVLRLAERGERLRQMNEHEQARYARLVVRSIAVSFERHRQYERQFLSDPGEDRLLELPSSARLEDDYVESDTLRRRLRLLNEVLPELREADRELLVGKYILGKSDEDLARQLGVKVKSVGMLLTRARRRARQRIEGKEDAHA